MKRHIGIVLKKYHPKKRVAVILDNDLGNIKCVPGYQEPVLGSLISYFITKQKPFCFIKNIEILHIPFKTAVDDILFLHHVLELCHEFIPPLCPSIEVFELIKYLYFFPNMIKYSIDKKIFLLKLFSLLGLYPEGLQFQTAYFHMLATKSIDTIISEHLHLKSEIEIDNWLHQCIEMQPELGNLKTINFLYKK